MQAEYTTTFHFLLFPSLFTAILNFAIVFFYDIKDGLLVVLLFIIGLTPCPFFFSCQSSGYEVYILEAPYKDPVVGLYVTH